MVHQPVQLAFDKPAGEGHAIPVPCNKDAKELQPVTGVENHLIIPVDLEIAWESLEFHAMIDSGATSNFINQHIVELFNLPTEKKE